MDRAAIIANTEAFVQETLAGEGTGHDWWHIDRVRKNALHIAHEEGADTFIVELGALLHDIADHKFHKGDHEVGPKVAREWLESQSLDEESIERIVHIVGNVSFSKSKQTPLSERPKELQVVQDADRLDALGAVGIARAFAYGGFKQRPLYDPGATGDNDTSVQHFYDKLLLLKDLMNTAAGKRMAESRHAYMEQYLETFYREWNGEL
jgi:uncharacterized protein